MTDRVAMGDVDRLRERIIRLERRSRIVGMVAAFALGIAALAVVAPGRGRSLGIIEAEKFIVRDRAGRERVVLGLDHPQSPGHSPVRLGLYNEEHGSSAVLYLSDAFAGLVTTSPRADGKGVWRAETFANPGRGAGFQVMTSDRRTPARLIAEPGGRGRVELEDATGGVIFRAP